MSVPGETAPPPAGNPGLPRNVVPGGRVRLVWVLGGCGIAALVGSIAAAPGASRSAAAQVWPPFVLVAGLLCIGGVANADGLFASAGYQLARLTTSGTRLFIGAGVMIGSVAALLNLDTSVAFLTPVLVATAKSRGEEDAPLLYSSLLLANAGSLFLPGSNLTNLIVLGHAHQSGAEFLARMWAPALSALLITALVVACVERRSLRTHVGSLERPAAPTFGLGLVAVCCATVLVVGLGDPALPVLGVGVLVTGLRVVQRKEHLRHVLDVLGVPSLVGLFGIAVALGTVGRSWSGPATLLAHLDLFETAGVAAVGAVLVNNLPAASLFAARAPKHPFALLIGLNLGPNLFVTGSLAWVLWLRAAKAAGARPSIAHASRIGVIAVPAAIAAAVGVLLLTGTS